MPLKHATGWRMLILLLLVWPFYQIIGTARHELSHALAAKLHGATITRIHIFPSWRKGSRPVWGYTAWRGGRTTWSVSAAPYVCDLITALVFFPVCRWLVRRDWWLWFHCWAFGLWAPLLNSAYAYFFGIPSTSGNDVAQVMRRVPREAVHLWFVVTLAFYAFAVWSTARARKAHDGGAGLVRG